jgi:hypothetical protein
MRKLPAPGGQSHPTPNLSVFRRHPFPTAVMSTVEAELAFCREDRVCAPPRDRNRVRLVNPISVTHPGQEPQGRPPGASAARACLLGTRLFLRHRALQGERRRLPGGHTGSAAAQCRRGQPCRKAPARVNRSGSARGRPCDSVQGGEASRLKARWGKESQECASAEAVFRCRGRANVNPRR